MDGWMDGWMDGYIVYFSDMYITTNTWEHEILLNEVPSPRGLISHYTYILYTKVQYKLEK